ncbi:hypothetical protein BpHYR1_033170, partial [Brachionus plicatilis]
RKDKTFIGVSKNILFSHKSHPENIFKSRILDFQYTLMARLYSSSRLLRSSQLSFLQFVLNFRSLSKKMSSISDSCYPTYYSDDDTSSDASEIEELRLHLDSIIA